MDTLHQGLSRAQLAEVGAIADRLAPYLGLATANLLAVKLVVGEIEWADRIMKAYPHLIGLWHEVRREFQK